LKPPVHQRLRPGAPSINPNPDLVPRSEAQLASEVVGKIVFAV
jgi:hypothetical protein